MINKHIYGALSKFLFPDSDENRFHCVFFTGLRLESSIAPTNLKKLRMLISNHNPAHVASARLFYPELLELLETLSHPVWFLCLV